MESSRRCNRGWIAAVVALIFAPLPASLWAAKVDFGSPLTITNGYAVVDQGVTLWDLSGDPITKLAIDFSGTTGIWLAMDSMATVSDERFFFSMTNNTGARIDSISMEFLKHDGTPFSQTPAGFDWATALLDKYGEIQVDWGGVSIAEDDNFVRLQYPFVSPTGWAPGVTAWFRLDWAQFNSPRTNWLLNIDLNEIDANDPTAASALTTPIPGAAWLFGSSLLGLLAFRGKRNA